VLGVTLSLVDFISQTILVLVLSLYWSADRVRFERLWLSLLPAEQRVRARTIWGAVETGVGAYIRSELVQSLIAVLVLSVGYTLIGIRYPVLIALTVALLWLVPLVGGLLALVVVLAAGLLSGPLAAGGAVALTVALLAVLEMKVEPRMFDRKSYNAILVLVVMIAMTDAFGLPGLVVAPALAVAIQICIAELTSPIVPVVAGTPSIVSQPSAAQATPQVAQIRDRLTTVHTILKQMDEPSPSLVNMADRLEGLVKRLDPIVEDEQTKGVRNRAR
jgi:predicted PurR-regulated permease PerM